MADVKVEIFKNGEIFKNITHTVSLDSKNLAEFSKNLRSVQKATNDALQALVESEKGSNGFIEIENEDDEDEDDDEQNEHKGEKRRKNEKEHRGHRKKIRGH